MKLPAYFLLQGCHQKSDNELFCQEQNTGNTYIFGATYEEKVSPTQVYSSFCL
jgi:hypothetical protein